MSKLTDDVTQRICKYIIDGHFVNHACTLVNINETTFYDWIDKGSYDIDNSIDSKYAKFCQSIKRAEATLLDNIYKENKKFAKKRDSWEMNFRWLESRFPKLFKREITMHYEAQEANRNMSILVDKLQEPEQEALPEPE